jgi:hypothetical protein
MGLSTDASCGNPLQRITYTGTDSYRVKNCYFHGISQTNSVQGSALSAINSATTKIHDRTFYQCATSGYSGAFYLTSHLIVVRCCGNDCSVHQGTFGYLSTHAGLHQFSQTTQVYCGFRYVPTGSTLSLGGFCLKRQSLQFSIISILVPVISGWR